MPQGNFAAYTPQEQVAAARQLLASRGLPINADNLNRAMHALYTNSDFVPPPSVARATPTAARALPLPPMFPEQEAPREVERVPDRSSSSEQLSNEADAASRADALDFLFNILPRVAALAPGPIGVAGRAASLADLFARLGRGRLSVPRGELPAPPARLPPPSASSPPPPTPPTPPTAPTAPTGSAADIGSRFWRLFTPEQPSQPPRLSTAPSRVDTRIPQYNTRTRRFSRRGRRQNAAESN